MKHIIEQLRDIRENDQVLSVGGDGCNMVQAIRTVVGEAYGVHATEEVAQAITFIEKVINTKHSVYDELDQLIVQVMQMEPKFNDFLNRRHQQ